MQENTSKTNIEQVTKKALFRIQEKRVLLMIFKRLAGVDQGLKLIWSSWNKIELKA